MGQACVPSRVLATVLALAFAGLTACNSGSGPRPQLRIGILAVLNGVPKETSGLPTVYGAELAAKVANDKGGIELGGVKHEVVLVIEDYEDRPDSASSVARALINQEQIDALVGPQFSRHAIPVSLVSENAGIPMVSPMSSNPATTEGKRFVFRLAFLDDVQGRVMGRFAAEELGAKKAAVLYDISTAYGRSLAEAFRRGFEEEAGAIVAIESYARDGPLEYGDQMSRIKKARPDVLYLPNDTERVVAQILQARRFGIEAVLLGGDTWDMEAFKAMPECDGAFVAHQWHHDLDTPETRRFIELYEQEHGTLPKVTAAMTFDAVGLLLRAIESGGSKEPEAIRAGLARTKRYTGATGIIRYDGSPDPVRSVVISQIRDGRSLLYHVVVP